MSSWLVSSAGLEACLMCSWLVSSVTLHHAQPSLGSSLRQSDDLGLFFRHDVSVLFLATECAFALLRCRALAFALLRCRTLAFALLRCRALAFALLRCRALAFALLRCRALAFALLRCRTLALLRCRARALALLRRAPRDSDFTLTCGGKPSTSRACRGQVSFASPCQANCKQNCNQRLCLARAHRVYSTRDSSVLGRAAEVRWVSRRQSSSGELSQRRGLNAHSRQVG